MSSSSGVFLLGSKPPHDSRSDALPEKRDRSAQAGAQLLVKIPAIPLWRIYFINKRFAHAAVSPSTSSSGRSLLRGDA
jgi:hypothetical protein